MNRLRAGFFVAAAVNIVFMVGIDGTIGPAVAAVDPALFGTSGRALVMIWGLAYLACGLTWPEGRWLSLVFAVEKAFYFASWVVFRVERDDTLTELRLHDPLVASFFSGYGLVDGAFAVFFLVAFIQASRRGR